MSGQVEFRLLREPERSAVPVAGPLRSAQEAELALDPELSQRIWTPHLAERLGRAYWLFLESRSRGLLRVASMAGGPSVRIAGRPRLELLRFRAPRYQRDPGFAAVRWPIAGGLLVGREGRGRGQLQLDVRASGRDAAGRELVRARSSVRSYYPLLRGRGRLARVGVLLYAQTQGRIHTAITRAFLRSLVALDLPVLSGEGPGPFRRDPAPRSRRRGP